MSLLTNLEAFYKLDGNSNDSAGSLNGTDTNVTYDTGVINDGAVFGASNSKISLGNNFNFEYTDAWSVSFWIKTSTSSFTMAIGKCSDPLGRIHGWDVLVGSRCYWQLMGATGADVSELLIYSTTATVVDGNWHHIVCTYDGSNSYAGTQMYRDGSSFKQALQFNSLNSSILNSVDATIGAESDGGLSTAKNMDEVGIWSRVLTSGEVTDLYNSGNGLSYSFGEEVGGGDTTLLRTLLGVG